MPAVPFPLYVTKGIKLGTIDHNFYQVTPNYEDRYHQTDVRSGSQYSVGHRRSPDGKYHEGGNWLSVRKQTACYGGEFLTVWSVGTSNLRPYYQGLFVFSKDYNPPSSPAWLTTTTEAESNRIISYGAQAYAALRPDKPDFEPFVSLAELLREAPGYLEKITRFRGPYMKEISRKRGLGYHLNKTGRYHLAIQFGWLPVLSDIINFVDALAGANKRLEQLLRDAGRGVRRRRRLYVTGDQKGSRRLISSQVFSGGLNFANPVPLGADCYSSDFGNARNDYYEYESIEVWCAGKSRYHLPDITVHRNLQRIKRRISHGFEVTPEVVYNLIPWSWFLDYFTNFGSVTAMLSGGIADNISFEYAYIMRTQIKKQFARGTGAVRTRKQTNTNDHQSPKSFIISRDVTWSVKSRAFATLFGWGINEGDLTPRQWSILGALGASGL